MLKANLNKIIIVIVTSLLVLLSFSNHFHQEAIDTIQEANSRLSQSSKSVFILKKGISFFSSSKIPLAQGYAQVSLKDLDKISNYLTASQVLLKLQTLILKFSNLTIFKLLPLVFCVGLFFSKIKLLSFKMLLVSLFLCPGLAIYTDTIHVISAKINSINLGGSVSEKLKETKAKFDFKEKKLKAHQEEIKKRQLAKAKIRGKDHISFLKRAEDAVVNTVEKGVLKIKEDTKLVGEVLLVNTETLFEHLIKLISTILLLVIVLPLGYFYFANILIKNLFHFNLEPYLKQVIAKDTPNEK